MSFVCPECRRESFHPVDERVGWCGACERFTGNTLARVLVIAGEIEAEGDAALAFNVRRRVEATGR